MATSRENKKIGAWMVRTPLQIERLRRELPQSSEIETQLRQLQRLRENLDAVVYALGSQKLAGDRREHLLEILRRRRTSLEACLAGMGMPAPIPNRPPLWYFEQLDPLARRHLASILGIPEEQPFYEVLDIKAEEYLSQHSAFELLGEQLNFQEVRTLERDANRPSLVLSLSGSLIQLSAPMSSRRERRYLYQNIYGNTHPPEGVLVLDRDIREGHRLRSVELTTSPVRMLRVLDHSVSWKSQTQNFERVARTLSSLVSRSSSRMAESGLIRKQTGLMRQVNIEAAERVMQEEYGDSIARFDGLRQRFIDGEEDDPEGDEGRKVEAELLTLCHYLQTVARELGFDAKRLPDINEFVTEGDLRYQTDQEHVARITMVSRGQGPDVVFTGVSVGRQLVTRKAPLALIGSDGGLVEVTRRVVQFIAR